MVLRCAREELRYDLFLLTFINKILTFLFLVRISIPQPLVEMYYSPTAVKVTWEVLNNNRTISGYKLHIVETGSSREPPLAPFEKIIKIQNASQTSLVISNLSIFTRYQIRMAAYSYKEVGDFSFPVIAGRLFFLFFLHLPIFPSSRSRVLQLFYRSFKIIPLLKQVPVCLLLGSSG